MSHNWIDRYIDNDLNEAEKELFDKNLKRNVLLRIELQMDEQLNHFLEDRELIELRQKIQIIASKPYYNFRKFTIRLAAASIVCLFFFGLSYYLLRTDPVKKLQVYEPPLIASAFIRHGNSLNLYEGSGWDSATYEPLTNLELSSPATTDKKYQYLAEYELLVGAVTRSSWHRVISPVSDLKLSLKDSVTFKVSGDTHQANIQVVMINNQGKNVFLSSIPESKSNLVLQANRLGLGLFYWKVIIDDEIMMVGKISIF